MAFFLKYLAILLVHLIWKHIGGGGPVPPIRIPKKPAVDVPSLSPWQVLIAFWLVKGLWKYYGPIASKRVQDRVKDRVKDRLTGGRFPTLRKADAGRTESTTEDMQITITPPPVHNLPAITPAYQNPVEAPIASEIPTPIPGLPYPARS